MKFSVIVPAYNAEADLPQCVDSVLRQTMTDWELILCDDGSTDGKTPALCDAIAARAPEKIRAIHRPNGGPGAARNSGLDAARGDYICFLDSDDRLAPEALTLLNHRAEETGADLIELGFSLERDGAVREVFPPAAPADRVVTFAEMPEILFSATSPWRRVYRRAFLEQTCVRFPEGVLVAEDLRFLLRLLPQAKGITAVTEALYFYVDRPGSIMRQGDPNRNLQVLEAFEDVCAWYQAQGLWETYYPQLAGLCVEHLLLSASVRVLRADPKSPLLQTIQDYVNRQFPDYRENPYVARLSKAQKLAMRLIEKKQYGAVKALFAIKDRIS